VRSRNGDGQIRQQIKPQLDTGQESGFIASTVAEQLQGFISICLAKMGWIGAQQARKYLFRHNPP
jgi:hypothetical protein